jgi:hypothetical protein
MLVRGLTVSGRVVAVYFSLLKGKLPLVSPILELTLLDV